LLAPTLPIPKINCFDVDKHMMPLPMLLPLLSSVTEPGSPVVTSIGSRKAQEYHSGAGGLYSTVRPTSAMAR